ncbi:MAG: sugar phosphate isomerase/epimerase [Pseudobutyrivibrio ruminis]|uniref:sugar phosphate isomerase/epimerase family protein n=1 Tax=Pseudobutyrivibrio ruminis TaxID=46206 RepID=UPI0026EC281F|nr:TIM barrel protein [Pseudobutyrivibrio ruminis]MBE5915115.1 sugar phosphate isomerase/epimerase [Pseudobutyrivibrio ruminis]
MNNLAVQQIMIGSACKDEKTTLSTLKRIKQVGYDGIELNLFMIEDTPLIVRLLTKMAGMPVGKGANIYWPDMLKESRLKATSLHADLGSLENRIDEVISKARELDTNKIVITGMYRFDYGNYDNVKSLAKRLDKVGARLHESDLQLLYHNHNVEFLKVDNKYTAYEMILKDTDPDLVKVEFDSYWPAEAGVEIIPIMEQLNDRLVLYHINDRGSRVKKAPITPILKSDSIELGYGNMPLKKILSLDCIKNADAIILESHRNWINNNPLESLEKSIAFLQENYIYEK